MFKPGDYVNWHNQLTGEIELGKLNWSYESTLGRHWVIERIQKKSTTTRSEKDLTKAEEPRE